MNNKLFKQKKKILVNTEASFSNTGYGVYGKNLLNRLHESGKYRLAEFACFTAINDPRDHTIKWRLYCNDPSPNDQVAQQQYNSNEMNKLGLYRWEKALLDFRPDIVIGFRDSQMVSYTMMSPLRKFYYDIFSPSLDSEPQPDDWVSLFLQSDCLLGYTDYALEIIEKETAGKAKIYKSAYPGADFDTFKPIPNKTQLRQSLGIDQNANIILMSGRNQIRKKFIELMKAFKIFLDKSKSVDLNIYNNSYLYLNTTLPDLKTWNISKALIELELTNKCLFTYNCTKCKKFFPNKFQDIITTCRFCGGEALLPRVNYYIEPNKLNEVYNLTDLYIQYASAGAAEFPLIEAAAAGCNIMATDWAGTGDVIRRLEGIPLKIACDTRCINVDADRAEMDNEFCAEEILKFFKRPRPINLRNGFRTSQLVRKKFNWDVNAEIWMEAIDNAKLTETQGRWYEKMDYKPESNFPDNVPIATWTYSILELGLQEKGLKHGAFMDEMIKSAQVGLRSIGNNVAPWSRKEIKSTMENMIKNKLAVEQIRIGNQGLPNEDWIQYAEIKELANL